MSVRISLPFPVWKSNAREADAKTGVSWREIEVKAEQVDTLMDFVTHVHGGYFRGNDERVCARNRDFARHGKSLSTLTPRAMRIREGWKAWAHEGGKEKQEREREKEKRHTLIYILQTHAPSPNDIPFEMESPPVRSPRTGPGTSWEREMPTYVSSEEIYTRPMREENSCQSPESALSAKEAVTIKIPEKREDTRPPHDDLLRVPPPSRLLRGIRPRGNVCYRILLSLSLPRFILHIKTGNVESYKGSVLRKCELSSR